MAIKYSGDASLASANLSLFGDGQAASVQIDLQQSPFQLDFKRVFPTAISVHVPIGEQPSSVMVIADGVIEITYPTALPEASLDGLDPRSKVAIHFLYG